MTNTHPKAQRQTVVRHALRGTKPRRGVMLFDLACGSAAIAVIMVGTMIVMSGFKKQQQQSIEYFLANQYLANVAEAIDALETVDESTAPLSESVALPDSAKRSLTKAELAITVQPASLPNAETNLAMNELLQVHCTITWEPDSSPNIRQASLTIWKWPSEKAKPLESLKTTEPISESPE